MWCFVVKESQCLRVAKQPRIRDRCQTERCLPSQVDVDQTLEAFQHQRLALEHLFPKKGCETKKYHKCYCQTESAFGLQTVPNAHSVVTSGCVQRARLGLSKGLGVHVQCRCLSGLVNEDFLGVRGEASECTCRKEFKTEDGGVPALIVVPPIFA